MESVPPQPAIGESSKVRTVLDLLNISKILALVVGILLLVAAAWYGLTFSIVSAIYSAAAGVINLILYMKMDEFTGMVNGRRYHELRNRILIWAVLGIIFGLIVGILLLVVYIELEELERSLMYRQGPPAPPTPPAPPP